MSIFADLHSAPRCFKTARGEWTCGHDHSDKPTSYTWEAPDGWTVQGLPQEEPTPETCYRCSLCDTLLWEHELDQHASVCKP